MSSSGLNAQLIHVASALIECQVGIIDGTRKILRIGYEMGLDIEDPDFVTFIGIDDQTDHLPVGDGRNGWSKEALIEKDREIREYESHFESEAIEAARRLVVRFQQDA